MCVEGRGGGGRACVYMYVCVLGGGGGGLDRHDIIMWALAGKFCNSWRNAIKQEL